MSPQLCSGRRWHCDVRSIPPLRLMRGDSGFGQDRCDMHSENRKHSLKRKKKKKRSTTDIFLLLSAWRQIKYTGGAQISAHRLGKKEKVTGVEKKSEIRWMCEIAVMVIWCAVDPVIGMKSHVLKSTFKESGFFSPQIVPWIIVSAQLSKDIYTTRAQGSLCFFFFFFFFFSPWFFTHPSVISGVSRVLTPRPPVSSAFRQVKRRFMDFFSHGKEKHALSARSRRRAAPLTMHLKRGGGYYRSWSPAQVPKQQLRKGCNRCVN